VRESGLDFQAREVPTRSFKDSPAQQIRVIFGICIVVTVPPAPLKN
jgi:hypothetical protein